MLHVTAVVNKARAVRRTFTVNLLADSNDGNLTPSARPAPSESSVNHVARD
jgi:hypothetical protein